MQVSSSLYAMRKRTNDIRSAPFEIILASIFLYKCAFFVMFVTVSDSILFSQNSRTVRFRRLPGSIGG
jgi:hypothetical protein